MNLKSKLKNNKEINKNRKSDFIFQIGNSVYVKNNIRNKLDERWLGPFQVTEVREKGNSVKVNLGRVGKWLNIKNIRPKEE